MFSRPGVRKGTHWDLNFIWNSGLFLPEGEISERFRNAVTRHTGVEGKAGTFNSLTKFLYWRVLLHLIKIWAPGGAKKISTC